MLLRLLTLAGCALAAPAPAPRDDPPPDPPGIVQVFADAGALDACPGYTASNVATTDSGLTADLTLAGEPCNVYSDDLRDLKLLVEYQTNDRLHVKIYDAAQNVFQVHEQVFPRPSHENAAADGAALQFDYVESPFSFTVTRKENGEVIFDTSASKLVFETQYVHLRTSLPQSPNIYGLGEHSDSFRMPSNYQRVFWNSESPNIPNNANLYGTHPVYFDHRGDKGTHGVFMLNANGMNINLNTTSNGTEYFEYNTIGGVIDLYFLAGKQPADVSTQYAELAGFPAMYPYWVFGFHQCKYGYWDVNMVAEVVGNYSTAGIPLEVMWTDIDYMELRKDFTLDEERFPKAKMRELVSTLHDRGQKYVVIVDPGIFAYTNYSTYVHGREQDVFLKHADGTDYLGIQWPGAVAWPDWLAPNTQAWWTEEMVEFYNPDTGIDIDGIWTDMNEASNFCPDITCKPRERAAAEGNPPWPTNSPRPNTGRPIPGFPDSFQPTPSNSSSVRARKARSLHGVQDMNPTPIHRRQAENGTMKGLPNREWFEPKYTINNHRGKLSDFTIYTNTSNFDGTMQYDTHNYYGSMMAYATHESMLTRRPEVRPFVLSRSTFAGAGRKVAHWFGDNESSWEHYRTSIRQMLSWVTMHQMPMVGSDVCGFNANADQYMCARWALLGAFQPFYRNHAERSTIPQEFYQWEITTTAGKKAIDTRYKLIDYAYTALYYQTTTGKPMINPLFFLYPNDANTFGIQHQWFYGDALLISPVVDDYSDQVTFYLPQDTFYDYWTHAKVDGTGSNITISNLTYTDIPVHIRGGTILPERANSANLTRNLRKEDFVLYVAPGSDGRAAGRLYLDEGERIEQPDTSEIAFEFDGQRFSCSGSFGYGGQAGESVTVARVVVLGQEAARGAGKYNAERKSVEVEGPWKLSGNWGFDLGS